MWLVKITLPSNWCFISLDVAPPSPQTHIVSLLGVLVSDYCCSSISVEQLSSEICKCDNVFRSTAQAILALSADLLASVLIKPKHSDLLSQLLVCAVTFSSIQSANYTMTIRGVNVFSRACIDPPPPPPRPVVFTSIVGVQVLIRGVRPPKPPRNSHPGSIPSPYHFLPLILSLPPLLVSFSP